MRTEYLNEFLVLVRYMNFTTAAKYLNLTQSALSKHIAALEKEFDCAFFNRDNQNLELTEQGRVLCVDALKILNLYRATQSHMRSKNQEVRLAGTIDDAAILKLVSIAKAKLLKADPRFVLTSTNDSNQPFKDLLSAKRIDLYIDVALESDPIDASCDSCILTTVPLVAIVNKQHPLALQESVSALEMEGQSIMCPIGSLNCARGTEAINAFFSRYDVMPGINVFFASSTRDFPFSNIGDSVFVTPRSNYSKQLFANIMEDYSAVPFREADAVFPYHMVWRKNESSAQVLAFRTMLIDVSEQLYPGNRTLLDQYVNVSGS